MNSIIVSHPTGNANVRNLINGFHEENILHSFYTSLAVFKGDLYSKLSIIKPLSILNKRNFDLPLNTYTHSFPYKEIGRMISQKFHFQKLIEHEKGIFSVDKVYQYLDKKVAKEITKIHKNISGIYGYEDGCLESFKIAKLYGLKCYYELPIAYWEYGQKLLKEEADRLPSWAETLKGGIKNSHSKLMRKSEELNLADLIITPSKFVADSLPNDAKKNKKIIISPFGSPASTKLIERKYDNQKPLRILFAGSMSQRKGLGDLFSAIKLLESYKVELVIIGSLLAPIQFYNSKLSNFTYMGTQPHNKVLEIMSTCDVFCLPSIVEGRALVMQEAMSQGLPVILTPNTGGEDLVIEGKTGFLVPIRSPEKIAEKIEWILNNKNELNDMSIYAQEHALKYTWENYYNNIIHAIQSIEA